MMLIMTIMTSARIVVEDGRHDMIEKETIIVWTNNGKYIITKKRIGKNKFEIIENKK